MNSEISLHRVRGRYLQLTALVYQDCVPCVPSCWIISDPPLVLAVTIGKQAQ